MYLRPSHQIIEHFTPVDTGVKTRITASGSNTPCTGALALRAFLTKVHARAVRGGISQVGEAGEEA